jgi:hypothetical protein
MAITFMPAAKGSARTPLGPKIGVIKPPASNQIKIILLFINK